MPASKPYISVIIPALNEEKYIGSTLKGFKEQSFRNFELIVVDGNSTDHTKEIARKFARVVIEPREGPGVARNTGSRHAKGEIIVFLDADTVPTKNLLRAYYNVFSDSAIVAATGPILPLEKTNMRIRLGYKFVTVLLVKVSILLGRASIVGSNFAVRSDAFRKLGGFNPKFITYEDWDLSTRLGRVGKVAYADDATVKTSARRAIAWGILHYTVYHTINIIMYYVLKKSRNDYEPIR